MTIDHTDLERPWDMVVVWHGAAGLAAAVSYLEARRGGEPPRVALLDRASREERGGSTAWTTASFRIDENAPLLEDWGRIVRETNGADANEPYIQAFYENATDTLNWIRRHGVRVQKYPSSVPGVPCKHAYGIEGGGRAFVDTFSDLFASRGGTAVYGVDAVGLERAPDGPVTGVRVRCEDGRECLMPAGAVVLAAGGFEGNREMLGEHIPGGGDLDTVAPGSRVNRGDGIRIAREIGAATAGDYGGAHMELVDPRSDNQEALVGSWMFGILVDHDGKRFFDEASTSYDMLFDHAANAVQRQAGGVAYAVNDASVRAGAPSIAVLNWTTVAPVVADTVEELARKLGIDAQALAATVREYNAAATDVPYDGTRCDGKRTEGIAPPKSQWAQPLTEAPFEAWPVSPRICFTYGGLRVDGEAHVLDEAGEEIAGLYAAGEITGVFRHTYPSGTSVLRWLTFGRIAGQGVAAWHSADNSVTRV